MAEAAPAKTEATPNPNVIVVTWNPTSLYGFNPLTSNALATGSVQFVTSRTCWVWTEVSGTYQSVFQGQTEKYVQCPANQNNIFNVNVAVGTTINIAGTDPSQGQPPSAEKHPDASVKGSIRITSMIDHK